MPVSGRELASLDFANLIGGPLNAIVEAQAKSAITTANFIKEVGFDKDGKIVNVDFRYNRKDDAGRDQEFCLTVPFLTMLPVPYITIDRGEIEFNAKITSITESKTEQNFDQVVDASVGGNYWFISAKVQSKTSYQKKSSTSDREERTFDMRVRVEVRNQDMPTGTERILTLLENVIEEKQMTSGGGPSQGAIALTVGTAATAGTADIIVSEHVGAVRAKAKVRAGGAEYTVSTVDAATKKLTVAPNLSSALAIGDKVSVTNPNYELTAKAAAQNATEVEVSDDIVGLKADSILKAGTATYTVTKVNATTKKLTVSPPLAGAITAGDKLAVFSS